MAAGRWLRRQQLVEVVAEKQSIDAVDGCGALSWWTSACLPSVNKQKPARYFRLKPENKLLLLAYEKGIEEASGRL